MKGHKIASLMPDFCNCLICIAWQRCFGKVMNGSYLFVVVADPQVCDSMKSAIQLMCYYNIFD